MILSRGRAFYTENYIFLEKNLKEFLNFRK